jgi:exonuclease III
MNVILKQVIKELQIDTWNVLTLYKEGVRRNLDKVLQEHRMDIIAIQEICWLGQ